MTIWLSELLMQNRQIETFKGLQQLIRQKAQEGAMQLQMDVKPPFEDTPDNWEMQLENAFNLIPGFGD